MRLGAQVVGLQRLGAGARACKWRALDGRGQQGVPAIEVVLLVLGMPVGGVAVPQMADDGALGFPVFPRDGMSLRVLDVGCVGHC